MGKPVLTMRGTDDVSRVLRHAAQGRRGTRGVLANVALDEPHAGSIGLKSCE